MDPAPSRILPAPPFPGDRGEPDPSLVAAVEAYAAGDDPRAERLLAALASTRLLVPVVAVLDDGAPDGGVKDSHMAAVSTTGRDGRRGLLAFSGLSAMARWDAAARPVPVSGSQAARAAIDDGADALVLDLAGPVGCAVERPLLDRLAGLNG